MEPIFFISNTAIEKIDFLHFISSSFLDLYKEDITHGNYLVVLFVDSTPIDKETLSCYFDCKVEESYITKKLFCKPCAISITGEFSYFYISYINKCINNCIDNLSVVKIYDIYPRVDERYAYKYKYHLLSIVDTISELIRKDLLKELIIKGFFTFNYITYFSDINCVEYDDLFAPEDEKEREEDIRLFHKCLKLNQKIYSKLGYFLPKTKNLYKIDFTGITYIIDFWSEIIDNCLKNESLTHVILSINSYEKSSCVRKIKNAILQNKRLLSFTLFLKNKSYIDSEIIKHIEMNRTNYKDDLSVILCPENNEKYTIPDLLDIIISFI